MNKSFVFKPAPLIFQLILSLGGGFLVGLLTNNSEYFNALTKPPLTPPAALFPIAWTILYTLMAISASLILSSKEGRDSGVIKIYYLQLIINFIWPFLFFVFNFLELSFIWILLLIALVGYMIYKFYGINKTAALLQIPYFLWLIFAAYLNLGYVILN